MKYYLKNNVFDAALDRIRYLFDEFENVVVGISGGKDSTVMFYLSLQVAREKGRLPLPVFFLDQEIEWAATIDVIREIMYHPDVKPMWFQIPFMMPNATSGHAQWLHAWGPGEQWVREQDPISIKENVYKCQYFAQMFKAIFATEFPNTPACYLSGVRTEESPARHTGLTYAAVYKGLTYGKVLDKKRKHFTFYPIYDWSYTDVWKAIFSNGWPYNKVYDYMYMHGANVKDMRVSNLHHETAVHNLFLLQEIEPDTYQKAVARIAGLDTTGKLGADDFFVYDLPYMFRDWKEYRDYLLEHLIENPEWKEGFRKKFAKMDVQYERLRNPDQLYKIQVNSILTNDFGFTKLGNWERRPETHGYRNFHNGKIYAPLTKYVREDDLQRAGR